MLTDHPLAGAADLDGLFARYRSACPDVEPGADFMPRLWARIERKPTFSFIFGRLARSLVTASAVSCLLLAALNMVPHSGVSRAHSKYATYIDALSAEGTLERTYYSEAKPPVRSIPADFEP